MYEIITPRQTLVFNGEIIGEASSHQHDHTHPADFVPSGRKIRCSACRWLEAVLYETDDEFYVAHTTGKTILPGETEYAKVLKTDSAYEVLEFFTVRPSTGAPFIPAPSMRVMAQAAQYDKDMAAAYRQARMML